MEIGRTATLEFPVADQDTAQRLLSGDLPVLGTPRLVAWLEAASCAAVTSALAPGQTSVGVRVSVEHRAASLVGAVVDATATLTTVSGRVLTFEVRALDRVSGTVLGEGQIVRALVDRDRFLARLGAEPGRADDRQG